MTNTIHYLRRRVLVTVLVLLAVFFTLPELSAQTVENPRRWSLDVNGGVPMPHFSVGSEITPMYGAALRYSASPMVTMKTAFYGGTLEGDGENYFGRDYQNDFLQLSLMPEINLMRVFQQSGLFSNHPGTVADIVDWYIYAGPGVIRSDVSVAMTNPRGTGDRFAGEEHQSYNFTFAGGTGLRFNLMPNLDLFFQYDLNYPTGTALDGYTYDLNTTGDRLVQKEHDYYSFATAGISIKFGSSSKNHAAWQAPSAYNARYIQPYTDRISQLEEVIDNREQTLEQMKQNLEQFSSRISQNANANAQQDSRMNQLATRMDSLESDMKSVPQKTTAEQETDMMEEETNTGLKSGYYVIAASFRKMSYANDYLQELKNQGHSGAIILRPGRYSTNTGYYRVAYKYFNNRVDAVEQLNAKYRNLNSDAWIKVVD